MLPLIALVSFDDVLLSAVGGLVMTVLSMTGFWLMIGRNFVTRSECQNMIADNIINRPEITEMIDMKTRILDIELKHLAEHRTELNVTMKEMIKSIDELKIAIATISRDR